MPNLPTQLKPEQQNLLSALDLADSVIYKTYLERLNDLPVLECPQKLRNTGISDLVDLVKVERFVYEKNENNRDKLISVFHAAASCEGSVIILINSDGNKIDYYIGAKASLAKLNDAASVLKRALTGNFPGTAVRDISPGNPTKEIVDRMITNTSHPGQPRQVCTVTGVAGLRSKDESHEKLFVQGMEKLIDAMQGQVYSFLLIADPVLPKQIERVKRGYETLYSELSPFAAHELTFGENESRSVSNSVTEGTTDTINKSITNTLSYTQGTNYSENKGSSDSVNLPIYGRSWNRGTSSGTSSSDTESQAENKGVSNSASRQEGRSDTAGIGSSRSLQIKFENKTVKNILEKIDQHLKRLNTSADTGMWNCSVYCLADDAPTSKIVAGTYQSLLRGENSSVETGLITEWEHDETLIPWLEKMHHPQLKLGKNTITPTSFISSAELTIHAGLPQTSVGGLPVASIAPFGREVVLHWENGSREAPEEAKVRLGSIYHMGKAEKLPVALNKKSLCSHTFITGSTGSGKSNTVYNLLKGIKSSGCHFLVVEPAKGEYKNVFGNDSDVSVYGANPAKSPLLRINPFTFPADIHVLEHLDRLVEIFNVCWPMYAAMPAVLKDAIENSYEEAGWNLRTSTNKYKQKLYPLFKDVVNNIRKIIDTSEYSEENKGNYKGALVTRLSSLANGINGMIFTADELPNPELFDKNVIVDLSRVGSMETKALIMGILVMKLQEYRMTGGGMNSDLQHLTVLEEAHNLLKRTSTEQSSESSNLLGKSVEMLANAIAEMRTYGEGFIIADQSPGLLDMSVIRNTNTKIILRLPDESDRELVGKAASLNDDQIVELARLQCGVAAVYQNDWIQPVLCKVEYFKTPETKYVFDNKNVYLDITDDAALDALKKRITVYLLSNMVKDPSKEDIDSLKDSVWKSSLETGLKTKISAYLEKHTPPETITGISGVIAGLYTCSGEALTKAREGFPISGEWARMLHDELSPCIDDFNTTIQQIIMNCIIVEISHRNKALQDLPQKWSGL